jgi:phenylacetic acid degradation operon negative regulatory protein
MNTRRNTRAAAGPPDGPTRRLTARSVIASTLLGVTPPQLPTRALVGTAEILGIAPGTARVAMSRMVTAGELEPTEDGYRLAGAALLARQARQGFSRTGAPTGWDGAWATRIVVADDRTPADRAALRAAMTGLRLAELRPGAWIRPDNLPAGVLPWADRLAADQCLTVRGAPDGDPAALAARLWDLDAWARTARALRDDLRRLHRPLYAGDPGVLAEGFVLSAAVLRHLQADPLLPADLLPGRWPGTDLRRTYDDYDAAYRRTLAAWQRAHHPSP